MYMDLTNIVWIVSGIAVVLLLWLWSTYNSFVTKRNEVKTDYADIDVQLKRRASLIENLAAVVREYAKHENKTFENVAKARSAIQESHSPKEVAKADNMLTQTLRSLFAVSESYPKLQASENYKRLNDEIEETENLVATARETYNQTVLNYNTRLQTFPNLLAANLFGFKEEELFDAGEANLAEVTL